MNRSSFLLLVFILYTAPAIAAESHISYLEGTVIITRGQSVLTGDFGMTLIEGDKISTGTDSLAILEVEGRGTLKMRSETILILDEIEEVISVSLTSGGLFSKIKRLLGVGYEVKTPGVVAGVRGTEFFVAFGQTIEDTPDLWLCVNEGTVHVALKNTTDSVLVNEGEGITIPAGNRLTDPRFYSWTEDLNWNTDPDMGELVDQTDLDGAYADLRSFDYD